ncbi:MAG: carbon-nitrogen family hydrolase [Roseiflexaceae bacterium]|nr:carbon-nitrogen family hydrolase [Roseiflexaceae bacterium]
MDIELGQPAANLAQVCELAAQAAAAGAQLLVLPELWSTGYDLERAHELATPLDGGVFAELAALAQQHTMAICGSALSTTAGRPANTAVLYGPDGTALGSYSKTHLFGLMHEDQWLAPGQHMNVLPTPWGPTALAICYDLRFPELLRAYAVAGAQLIIMPSEWPHPRLEHWRTLVRARAIENQCFVVACNRVGSDRASRFCGHSLVIDPWGEVLVEGDESATLLFARLDLDLVAEVRSRMSVLRDRRPDLYGA